MQTRTRSSSWLCWRCSAAAGDDRQERIAARERRQIDFRVERAVGAQEHVHARAQAHDRQRRLGLRVEDDRIADRREAELIHRQRHQVRVGQERERIADLADAELAVLLDRERLELAIKEDFAQRLLAAAGRSSWVSPRVPYHRAAVQTTNARVSATVERKSNCCRGAFPAPRRMLCPRPRACATQSDMRGADEAGRWAGYRWRWRLSLRVQRLRAAPAAADDRVRRPARRLDARNPRRQPRTRDASGRLRRSGGRRAINDRLDDRSPFARRSAPQRGAAPLHRIARARRAAASSRRRSRSRYRVLREQFEAAAVGAAFEYGDFTPLGGIAALRAQPDGQRVPDAADFLDDRHAVSNARRRGSLSHAPARRAPTRSTRKPRARAPTPARRAPAALHHRRDARGCSKT